MMEKSQRSYDEFVSEARKELLEKVAKGELSKEEIDRLKKEGFHGKGVDSFSAR